MCVSKVSIDTLSNMDDKHGGDVTETKVREVTSSDHEYFKSMLDLIPAQFYFDKEAKEKLTAKRPRASNDSDDDDKQLARAKQEWKRSKFDPSACKTVTELQRQLVDVEDGKQSPKRKKTKGGSGADHVTLHDHVTTGVAPTYTSLTDLQQKFQAKLDCMKEKRHALGQREHIEKKRLARKMSKLKLKMKNKSEKYKKTDSNGKAVMKSDANKTTPSKPVFNKEGHMVFSKFDFKQAKDKKKSEKSGKNYKQLLQKVEKQKEKEQELAKTDQSAAQTFKEKNQWQSVLQKAEGVKVKDNPELLKKSIKLKDKLKKQSVKSWEDRQEKTDKRMQDRQKKRKTNIKKRKEGRVDKKIKKSKKKGHIIPGF